MTIAQVHAVIMLVLLMLSGNSFSQERFYSPEMPQDIREIQEYGALRVSVMKFDVPPFVFEKDGVLTGSDVELARDIAESLGVKAEFVRTSITYDGLVDTLIADEADIVICELSKTISRDKAVYFANPHVTSGYKLILSRLALAKIQKKLKGRTPSDEDILRLLNSKEFTIAAMKDSTADNLMTSTFLKATLHRLSTSQESFALVYEGKIAGAVLPYSILLSLSNEIKSLDYKVQEVPLDYFDPLAIAINPRKPDLLRLINDYLQITFNNKTATVAEINEKYALGPDDSSKVDASKRPLMSYIYLGIIYVVVFLLLWVFVIRKKRETHWLLNAWVVVSGMVLGGITGVILPQFSEYLLPPTNIFMNFWKLCVLPIMATAVITSIYRLLASGNNSRLIKRIAIIIPTALLLISILGVFAGIIGQPGADFPPAAQQQLLQNVSNSFKEGGDTNILDQVLDVANNIVTPNLTRAMAEDKRLGVLFVSFLFAVMLARGKSSGRDIVINALDSILETFTRMICLSLYLLPFILFALSYDFISDVGIDLLMAILKLSLCISIAALLVIPFSILMLRIKLRLSLSEILSEFGSFFLVALSARSAIIAMPVGIEAFKKNNKHVNGDQAVTVLPLAILVCSLSYTVFYSIMPIFIAQVFGVELGVFEYCFIIVGAVLCTLASIGSVGLSFIMFLSITCVPLNLPLEPAFISGVGVIAVLDPVLSLAQAIFSCGMTTFLIDKNKISLRNEAEG